MHLKIGLFTKLDLYIFIMEFKELNVMLTYTIYLSYF
jgi:hypothetical protein